MVGFTEGEISDMLSYYESAGVLDKRFKEEVWEVIRENYGGYRFYQDREESGEEVYNSDMVLYLLKEVLRRGRVPEDVLDYNIRTDYEKIRHLVMIDKRLNGNFSVLTGVLETGEIAGFLADSFMIREITDTERFKSFLYFLGMLTFKGMTKLGEYVFGVPNKVIKRLLWEYVIYAIEEAYDCRIDINKVRDYFVRLTEGDWRGLFEYIFKEFYELVSVRDFIWKEEGVKWFIIAYVMQARFYEVESEAKAGVGYADLYIKKNRLVAPEIGHEYVIELKYVKKGEERRIEEIEKEAEEQVKRYADAINTDATLHRLIIIFGSKDVINLKEV